MASCQFLRKAGSPAGKVKGLGSLKLPQALLNIVEHLDAQQESVDAFVRDAEPAEKNDRMAPLFLTNRALNVFTQPRCITVRPLP